MNERAVSRLESAFSSVAGLRFQLLCFFLIIFILVLIFYIHLRLRQNRNVKNDEKPDNQEKNVINDITQNEYREEEDNQEIKCSYNISIACTNPGHTFCSSLHGNTGKEFILAILTDEVSSMESDTDFASIAIQAAETEYHAQNQQSEPSDRLLGIVAEANKAVVDMKPEKGLNYLCIGIQNNQFWFLSIGNPQLYLIRNNLSLQLNREHVLSRFLALKESVTGTREGDFAFKENGLTSSLGTPNINRVDRTVTPTEILPGDQIVMVSGKGMEELDETLIINREKREDLADTILQSIRNNPLPNQGNRSVIVISFGGEIL